MQKPSTPSPPVSSSNEIETSPILPHINFGEQRGTRKLARAHRTALRRQQQARQCALLASPPTTSEEAAARWDSFYRTKPTLFKDRHLLRSFCTELVAPQVAHNPKEHIPPLSCSHDSIAHQFLQSSSLTTIISQARSKGCSLALLECGCGSGNAVYPLLRANPRLFAFSFDFSAEAVAVVRASPEYCPERIFPFQADLTDPSSYLTPLKQVVPAGANFVTAFWALSALPSAAHQSAVQGLADALVRGGILFVRDYAVGDMRQQKFLRNGQLVKQDPTQRLFLRGDGTYAYFFDKDQLVSLFTSAGLTCLSCECEQRVVQNRKQASTMHRCWIQAKFSKSF